MPDLLFYDNEEMQVDLRSIARDIARSSFKPDYVLGIARGGLVPATHLSHYFEIPLITATVSLRDAEENEMLGLDRIVELLDQGKKILMVDDICDSGETLKLIWGTLDAMVTYKNDKGHSGVEANLHTAVLWNNPAQDEFHPDYYGREIDRDEDDRWVVFPWENWWKF